MFFGTLAKEDQGDRSHTEADDTREDEPCPSPAGEVDQ